jgi:hypothetical protein
MDSKNRLIVIFFTFLIFSCAQVGTISGGAKDEYAPKPKTINPINESLNFSSKKIVIQFDEYIKLNNPTENIIIVPKGIKINAKVEKKSLILNLEGDFEENTTYQIIMNAAVKDINEGNDSLMYYVFSTGDKIDTLSYSGKVSDAYSGELLKETFVGLYQLGDSLSNSKPSYFAKTDAQGEFKISYLKNGQFQVFAFEDKNKDMTFQITEKVGFRDSALNLTTNVVDTNSILLFESPQVEKIKNKNYISPALIKINSNYSLENTEFYYKDEIIDKSNYFFYSPDSLALLLPEKPKEDFLVIAKNKEKIDSLTFKTFQNKKSSFFSELHPLDKDISKTKAVMLIFADEILSYDTSLVQIMDLDSNFIDAKIDFSKNTFSILIPKEINKNLSLTIFPKGMVFSSSRDTLAEKLSFLLINKGENEFGSIVFKNLDLPQNALVEFLLKNKVVATRSAKSLLDFPKENLLLPGEYTFRIVIDENQNSKWDAGSILEKKQAEKVLYFPEKVKIRANWETELELEFKNKTIN